VKSLCRNFLKIKSHFLNFRNNYWSKC